MNPTQLLRLTWPDVLERIRQSGFLLTVGTTIWLGSLVYTHNIKMSVGEYRGVVNSAWLGTLMALSATTFCLDRDSSIKSKQMIAVHAT